LGAKAQACYAEATPVRALANRTWEHHVVIAAVETLQLIITIVLLIAAVGAGFWVGKHFGDASRKARKLQGRRTQESLATSIGKSAQDLISGSAVKVWRWRRDRKRQQRDRQ
jgi:hypothetical protein